MAPGNETAEETEEIEPCAYFVIDYIIQLV